LVADPSLEPKAKPKPKAAAKDKPANAAKPPGGAKRKRADGGSAKKGPARKSSKTPSKDQEVAQLALMISKGYDEKNGKGVDKKKLVSLLDDAIRSAVQKEDIAGAVAMVTRGGDTVYDAKIGSASLAQGATEAVPMSKDTVFRIASMTKVLTSVAAMLLWEEGKLMLNEPISKHIPNFGSMKVLTSAKGATRDATTAITARHLLTHTSGLAYCHQGSMAPAGSLHQASATAVDAAGGFDVPTNESCTEQAFLAAVGDAPLIFEPGTDFSYSLGTDVLGILISRIAQMPLSQFIQQRILSPLALQDTAFSLKDISDGEERLATLYHRAAGAKKGSILEATADEPTNCEPESHLRHNSSFAWSPKCKFEAGGAGMCSTVGDYTKLLQALMDCRSGTAQASRRVLGRKTVEMMTTNALPPNVLAMLDQTTKLTPGWGFGFGFAVLGNPAVAGAAGSPGLCRWGGIFGTEFFFDPKEALLGVLMTQKYPRESFDLGSRFAQIVCSSIQANGASGRFAMPKAPKAKSSGAAAAGSAKGKALSPKVLSPVPEASPSAAAKAPAADDMDAERE